ncbi:MAG: hypothetical protein IPJ23_13700 [Ignavibacteriales bacterium]|nr:hypothetical protein [Ignavibacteriales bacterium]
MDIFKQKRYLIFVIVLLVILNLATILMIWLNKPPQHMMQREQRRPEQEKMHIQQLLKDELGFDKTQTEQYLKLRKEQQERASLIQNEIQRIKKQMFDEVLKDNPQTSLSDSLLKLSQEKMADLEQLTFRHFLDLKKLCKPDQQDKLKFLIGEFFHQNPPAGMNNDGPPPPPGNEPPPPNKN